jgi:hypothetical protein
VRVKPTVTFSTGCLVVRELTAVFQRGPQQAVGGVQTDELMQEL